MYHNRACADLDVVANADAAQHLRAGSNNHAISQSGVPLALLVARAAERHALIKEEIVADLGSLADDHAGTVVDKEPAADARARMNLDPGEEPRRLRDHTRDEGYVGLVQSVREPVEQYGVKTRVTEENFEDTFGGGVFTKNRFHLLSNGPKNRAL